MALAVGFSAAIGRFFGIYPANQAARLNPRRASCPAVAGRTLRVSRPVCPRRQPGKGGALPRSARLAAGR
jgi:hypothetical protein